MKFRELTEQEIVSEIMGRYSKYLKNEINAIRDKVFKSMQAEIKDTMDAVNSGKIKYWGDPIDE